MISALAASLAFSALLQADTTLVLATSTRDLNGDSKSEVLTLVGVGRSADSLDVTISVEEAGRTIYRAKVFLLSRGAYERRLRSILGMSYEAWLKDVGQSFFADAKFTRPPAFLQHMSESIPGHIDEIPMVVARDGGFPTDSVRALAIWSEIQRAGMTIFQFSPGGDGVTAIAWSPRDRRFYRLLECC